ncbi:zinc finger protein-like [Tropilaelaps mercedesae]|uniref:Zinc finger protein-like n=1 Tax=Tropilaelaps mercedesae TaxID=418985 RepID=A0A1V9XVV2_9ACAR|nr:zinc finger protein-like [Tropilaelaps mercedesae]
MSMLMPSETEESEEEMKKYDFVAELFPLPSTLGARPVGTGSSGMPPMPAHSASIFELLKLKIHNGEHKRERTTSSTSGDFISPSTALQHFPLDFRTSS